MPRKSPDPGAPGAPADATAALNAAVRLLTRREYSRVELYRRLAPRFGADLARDTVHECVARGYQSEERFADMLLRHCQSSGYGPLRFRLEARRRGLSAEVAGNVDVSEPLMEGGREWLARHGPREFARDGVQARERLLAALGRRGFTAGQALELLRDTEAMGSET